MKNFKKYLRSLFPVLLLLIAVILDFMTGHLHAGEVLGMAILLPFGDLPRPSKKTRAGIQTDIYIVPIDDILQFPTLSDSPTTPEQAVTLIGNFQLKSGKFWYHFYSTKDMAELTAETQGNQDNQYFQIKGSFFYPGTDANALGVAAALLNTPVIMIMKEYGKDCTEAQMRVIGTKCEPVYITMQENSGKAVTDQKGITFNFEVASTMPALIYNGDIALPYSYEVTDITGTSSSLVSGYDGVTGWNEGVTLYFAVVDNAGTTELRAYESQADMDAGANQVFHVVWGNTSIVADNSSSYSGTLVTSGTPTVGDQWSVLKTI